MKISLSLMTLPGAPVPASHSCSLSVDTGIEWPVQSVAGGGWGRGGVISRREAVSCPQEACAVAGGHVHLHVHPALRAQAEGRGQERSDHYWLFSLCLAQIPDPLPSPFYLFSFKLSDLKKKTAVTHTHFKKWSNTKIHGELISLLSSTFQPSSKGTTMCFLFMK